MNLKSRTTILVRTFVVWSKVAQILGRVVIHADQSAIGVNAASERLFEFIDDDHVAVVSVLVEQNLAPIAGGRLRSGECQIGVVIQTVGSSCSRRIVDNVDAVAVRVGLWEASCI